MSCTASNEHRSPCHDYYHLLLDIFQRVFLILINYCGNMAKAVFVTCLIGKPTPPPTDESRTACFHDHCSFVDPLDISLFQEMCGGTGILVSILWKCSRLWGSASLHGYSLATWRKVRCSWFGPSMWMVSKDLGEHPQRHSAPSE